MAVQPVATESPVDLNAILSAPDIANMQRLQIDKTNPKKVAVIDQKPPDPGIGFKKSEFVQSESTGVEFGKHSEKKYSLENDTVRFSPELQAQFKSFLTTHVESLLRISNPQILDNPQHIHEKKLLQVLTKDGQLDKNALENFLKTSDGWVITSMLIENQTALKLFAAGLEASIDPQGIRSDKINSQTIYLHADQSNLSYWMKERFGGWLAEQHIPEFMSRNRRALAIAGGLEAGMTAVGALLGKIGGYKMLFHDGLKIDLTRCVETLKTIKGIRGESEYLLQVLGIDVNNIRVNAAGQVEKNPGHVSQGRLAKDIQNEIFQGLFVRRQFLGALGVPPNAMDALPEQFLFDGSPSLTGASPEQTGAWWSRRIQEKLGASVLASTSESKRLKAFMRVRKEVMMEYLTDHLAKVADNTDSTTAISRFEEKKKNKGVGGAELAERKVVSDKKIAELDKEKAKLADPEKAAKAYQEAQKAVEDALEAFKKDYPTKKIDSIDLLIKQLGKSRDDVLTVGTIAFKVKAIADAKEVALNNALNNAMANIPPKADQTYIAARVSSIEEAINKTYDPQLKMLEAEETKITEKITNLKAIKIQYDNAQKDLLGKSQALLGYSGRVNLSTIEANYKIVGTGGLPNSIGIQDTQLGVLTIDEIMVEINKVNTNNGRGWAETGNKDPINRQLVIDAVAEAKARLREAIDPDKVMRDIEFNQIITWGNPQITDTQLRNLSRSQLLNLIHLAHGARAVDGWTAAQDVVNGPRLDRAIAEAKNRMILRYSGTVEERIKDLTSQAENEKDKMENISFKDDLDVLDVVSDLMNQQGKVFSKAYAIASNREQYANNRMIAPTDPAYSQAEKDIAAPQGYWEIMDALLGYKTKADRSIFVPKMLRALPPEALAREIYNHLQIAGIVIPAVNLDNIAGALTLLNTSIQNRRFQGPDTFRMVADIVNNLRAKADAI
ncbi:MAG: hypothetical protein WC744_01915 [Patescibacteria group bacterium]|jgi:hypothetical protein